MICNKRNVLSAMIFSLKLPYSTCYKWQILNLMDCKIRLWKQYYKFMNYSRINLMKIEHNIECGFIAQILPGSLKSTGSMRIKCED